ncbi:hypothetical protein SAMN04487934_12313 [Eubacterium ruminantium]|nr:hypothetical protein SAMN04487934_12313 [Eubacterium ruminantium]
MNKRAISVLLIYVIVISCLAECRVYAGNISDHVETNTVETIDGDLASGGLYRDQSAGNTKSDRIIVSLGDSYSSGEGIEPFYGQYDVNGKALPFSKKVKNDDWLAHRSMYAWSGMLKLLGVDRTMADNKETNWFFAAASKICSYKTADRYEYRTGQT